MRNTIVHWKREFAPKIITAIDQPERKFDTVYEKMSEGEKAIEKSLESRPLYHILLKTLMIWDITEFLSLSEDNQTIIT